jgi:hypothetical protein
MKKNKIIKTTNSSPVAEYVQLSGDIINIKDIMENYSQTFTDLRNYDMKNGNPKDNEAQKRKDTPIFSGVLKYFPLAIAEVSRVSLAGNRQHHPNEPLHWDRSKSTDELDALTRHLMDAGTLDTDGVRHSAKLCWRSLANLEKELEKAQNESK